ncbi:uncharacterized protein EI90DRAFT_3074531 [Cantharellus anzutake]|uniref:uncharacterized protein n=1 Tax=Cantharellus anzutake TaxID=1750568 RepID=UPI0019073E61|nr:uncharacterized protein EI90DRAFT_3074531 [Cantharellus anzutake]KAF8324754.1 hypothetical protein EI90DRAFT_3074531 [Cantharellus anzutake]
MIWVEIGRGRANCKFGVGPVVAKGAGVSENLVKFKWSSSASEAIIKGVHDQPRLDPRSTRIPRPNFTNRLMTSAFPGRHEFSKLGA